MSLETLAKALIAGALVLLLAGGLLLMASKLGLPKLPGDFALEGRGWKIYFPLATSILLSILLTVLLNLLGRFWR